MTTLAARAWGWWLLTLSLVIVWVRNPLYLALLLLTAHLLVSRRRATDMPSLPLWRLGAVMLFFSAAFNLAFVHQGANIIGRLPAHWPLIGGPWTWEAAIAGLINGLTLWTLLVAFAAFNQAVDPDEVVRFGPRALRDLGIVLLIALTYVPQTWQQWQRIREAQAIRGHTLRGWRDWRPLVLPLLVGGLERALALAESMAARGYGYTSGANAVTGLRLALFSGLLLTLVGWAAALWWGGPGWLILALGLAVLMGAAWLAGRQVTVSRFRPPTRSRRGVWLVVLTTIPLLLTALDRAAFAYSPYPDLTWPSFQPGLALALLLFAVPLILESGPTAASMPASRHA